MKDSLQIRLNLENYMLLLLHLNQKKNNAHSTRVLNDYKD